MSFRLLVAGCVAAATSALVSGQSTPPAPPPQVPATLPTVVSTAGDARGLVDRYCVGCHNQKARSGTGPAAEAARKLALDTLDTARIQDHGEAWEMVVRKLRAGMMPPSGIRRPDRATLTSLITWLEGELDRDAVPYMPPPGLHRLNRTEYANAVRELLALDIDASKYLPSDDSTHGFDNIAGALGISSTLVEAYVSAAEKLSRLALGEATRPTLVVYRTPEDTSQDYHIEGLPFGTRGGMLVRHLFPSDGEYAITVTPIFGDNMSPTGFGSVPCEKLEVLLDGERVQLLDWQGGFRFGVPQATCRGSQSPSAPPQPVAPPLGAGLRNSIPKMTVRVTTTAGPHEVGVTFPATNLAPLLDLDQHFSRDTLQTGPTPGFTFFPHVGTVRIEGPFNASPASDSPSRRKIFVCRPVGPADEPACARRIVTHLLTRAYRRPATAADAKLMMGFYQTGRKSGDFDRGIEFVLARILASPKFIYRIEAPPAGLKPGQPYRLSDLDLASRLSFFLWSTIPDDELLSVAAQGRLKNAGVLEQQVRRMLKDPRAEALAVNFAGQWLNLRGMDGVGPLPMLYPDFDDPLRQAMRREVELLFDSVVQEDRSVIDLLTADYTFVNERLAKHYGIPNIYGSQFRRVTLGPEFDVRRGLLGKGALLATTSKPERTSPVTRGKWVMSNILGIAPPLPPPDVPPLPARTADATGNTREPTMRQKMQDHRVRADCTQCHKLMDPIGFSLENFDAIGLWRTEDEGQTIDAAAQVFDGTNINGPADLRRWLLSYTDQFAEVVAEKLLTYALGRGVDYRDMPLVRSVAREASHEDDRFSALVLSIVKSRAFLMNGPTGEPAGTVADRAPEPVTAANPRLGKGN
jgi:hypothetical protein